MIERSVFKIIQSALGVDDALESIKLRTFSNDQEPKPFIIYTSGCVSGTSLGFSLKIISDYKGLSEISDISQKLICMLEQLQHQDKEKNLYVFKHKGSQIKEFDAKGNQTTELSFQCKKFNGR